MILVADSGATKTDWGFGDCLTDLRLVRTEGINPFHQDEGTIRRILKEQLSPQIPHGNEEVTHIHFYGAGCTPEKSVSIRRILQESFPSAIEIHAESDLLGAARASCGHEAGIACILGTGSNSCLYDGKDIIDHIPPLGYILGDEGSGAYLGKRFMSDCLKRQLPESLLNGLLDEYRLTPSLLLDHVYRMPQANRFLAGLTPYISKHKKNPLVHRFLIDCFDDFFRRNVYLYGNKWPVSFVGSIGWHFQEEIRESASAAGFTTRSFIKSPINGLVRYHLENTHI